MLYTKGYIRANLEEVQLSHLRKFAAQMLKGEEKNRITHQTNQGIESLFQLAQQFQLCC